MTAFGAWRLARMLRRAEARAAAPPPALALGALLAVLMTLSAFPRMTRDSGLWPRPSPWDGAYAGVVRHVSGLSGRVVCPEDPTIPLYAKGQAGRNIFLEFDSHPAGGAGRPPRRRRPGGARRGGLRRRRPRLVARPPG
jgi:hypothetical protein